MTRTYNVARRTFIVTAGDRHTYKRAVGTVRTVGWGRAMRALFIGRRLTVIVIGGAR